MRFRGSRRMWVGLVCLGVAAGCGESALPGEEALAEVETGTPQEEVLAVLPEGEIQPAESGARQLVRGYRAERYFTDGASIQVVWLHREGSGGEFEDARAELTPVVFRNDELDGWGWEHFDRRAEEWGLASPGGGREGAT